MVVAQLHRDWSPMEAHRVGETPRVPGISKAYDSMKGRIHEIFDLGCIVGHGACRDKIQILYLDLDLFYLPSEKNMNEFLMEIGTAGLEARKD